MSRKRISEIELRNRAITKLLNKIEKDIFNLIKSELYFDYHSIKYDIMKTFDNAMWNYWRIRGIKLGISYPKLKLKILKNTIDEDLEKLERH